MEVESISNSVPAEFFNVFLRSGVGSPIPFRGWDESEAEKTLRFVFVVIGKIIY